MLKSGIYDFVICRGGTDMCFVLGCGRKRPDLKQYRISGLATMKDKSYEHEEQWMLHGNVSRKGYGNALSVGMVAVLRKDIMRLMMTERIMPRVWMHRRSMRQLSRWETAMPGTEEARKR